MKRLKAISIGVVSLLAVVVLLQNTQTVETRILWMSLELPRAILLFVTLLLGFLLGLVVATLWRKDAAKAGKQGPGPVAGKAGPR